MDDTGKKVVTLDDIYRRNIQNHHKPYFDWLRHTVTLAVGALTALVALQGHYIPRNPVLKPALAACWIALLLTIVLGLVALLEEHRGPLRAAVRMARMRAEHGDAHTARHITHGPAAALPWTHRWASRSVLPMLLVALSALCTFAVSNLLMAAGT